MDWYEPDIRNGKIINPLSDILTGDYEIDIDIASARQENRQDKLNKMFFFMTQLAQIRPILNAQMKDINIDEIRKISKEFGWNPDKIFVDFKPQLQPTVPTAGGETINPEEDAARQAEAEARAGGEGGAQI